MLLTDQAAAVTTVSGTSGQAAQLGARKGACRASDESADDRTCNGKGGAPDKGIGKLLPGAGL